MTHPMSLDYHLTQMPWAEVCRKAVSLGYLSHQAGTCGLHVHVSRAAFGDTPEKQDAVIARILYFFEKHWEELLKFSRRTPAQLDRWAARYGYQEQPKDILEHAKMTAMPAGIPVSTCRTQIPLSFGSSGAHCGSIRFSPPCSCWTASVMWPWLCLTMF